jgi:hypothetical protein
MLVDVLADTCKKKKTEADSHRASSIIKYFTYRNLVAYDALQSQP